MAPLTRGRKRQITTTKATSPQTRGRKRQTTTKETTTRGVRGGKGKGRRRQTTTKETTTTSPQTRGGGGGKGKGRKRQTTTKETISNERTIDEEEQLSDDEYYRPEQLSDDEYYRPARETVLAECRKKKEESKKESKRGLKSLIIYLKEMGMPAEQTFEQAIRQLVEGSLDAAKKDRISKRTSKYILLRLLNTTRILVILQSVRDWDHEVVSLISESLKDFREDLPVRVPELEDIARDAAYVLQADKEWQVRMGNAMKDRVFHWTWNSSHRDKMMKEWAKCPTRTIVTGFKYGCPGLG